MRIFFVVLAKPLGEASAIHITEENNTIDGKTLHENDLTTFELKKLIWKELVGNEEGSNKANQWTLWKVEDLIEGGEKWKALEDIEDSNTETFIKHKLNGKKLTSAMGLKDVFSVDPPRGVIHIIVKMPTPTPATTGKCLPMVYLSNKKFADLLLTYI
jgi:Crinkler effector protein N-terminal domain